MFTRCWWMLVKWPVGVLAAALTMSVACGGGGIFNAASLGGNNPGDRANLQVIFINNTPFRAIFTYGTYDPLNKGFRPDARQFSADADPALRLERDSESEVITFTRCGRAFSLGGAALIDRLKDAGLTADLREEALQPGIAFSDKPLDDPGAGQATAGRAPEVVTEQGVEYPCGALLIYTLEVDPTQPSGFRVGLEVMP